MKHHFCKVSIEGDELSFTAIDDDNNIIDQFTIDLSSTSSTEQDLQLNNPIFSIAPNPFANTIQFLQKSPDSKPKEIEIYNISGRLIKRIDTGTSDIVTWRGKDQFGNKVQNGIYIYRILYDNNVKTGKIIKIDK